MTTIDHIMALADDYVEVYADRQALRAAIEQRLVGRGEPVYQLYRASGDMWRDVSEESYSYNLKHGTSEVRVLFTTPQPQREWVGLTNPERAKILAAIPAVPFEGDWHSDLIDAIEARLREKNGGAA